MSTINDSGNFIPRLYSFMPHAADPKPRSNLNPILAGFRRDTRSWANVPLTDRVTHASDWAQILTGEDSPGQCWRGRATVSEQVFAARVLYRYAGVFSS